MRWYVGFLPSQAMGLYKLLGGRNVAHVFCFRPTRAGQWLLVERTLLGLELKDIDDRQAEVLIAKCQADGQLLLVKPCKYTNGYLPPLVETCVSTVKAILRVRDPCVWTAAQLHCALLKHGAEPL